MTTVSDSKALLAALQTAKAGDTILLASGAYGVVSIDKVNVVGAVTIQSEDKVRRAVLNGLYVSNSSGLTFSNLELTATPRDWYSFRVTDSQNIHFAKIEAHGSEDGDTTNDFSAFYILRSKAVSIKDSSFHDLNSGILHADSAGLEFSGNDFYDIQNHGIQGAGSSNVRIDRNRFRDFYPQPTDHPDAIIFWQSKVVPVVHDLTISDNIITQGLGRKNQGILLRDATPGVGPGSFQRVTITGNILAGTQYNGISVMNASLVTLKDNVVRGYPDMQSWIRFEASSEIWMINNKADLLLVGKGVSNLRQS